MQKTLINRTIFVRDNLEVLRGVDTGSVDLIYLDPPFNKKKVFMASIGSSAEGANFRDIFKKEDVKEEWLGQIADEHPSIYQFIQAAGVIENGYKQYNKYYLAYMGIRILEMHRILKETGSLYLHCDQTVGHYLKLLLDCIFGEKNFRNEIVWHYETGGVPKRDFARKHDTIYRFTRSENYTFNAGSILESRTEKSLRRASNPNGARVLASNIMRHPSDVFRIAAINAMAKERTGYPTQKPLALLERIIKASSNPGDFVLDPFCGCATTCVAAEKLGRRWVGVDISKKAYDLVRERLAREVQVGDVEDRQGSEATRKVVAEAAKLHGKHGRVVERSAKKKEEEHLHIGFSGAVVLREDILARCDQGLPPKRSEIKHILFGKQEGDCAGCEVFFEYRHFEVDHIVPRSKGGGDDVENLQLLCGNCNRRKGKRSMEELLAENRELGFLK